MSGWRDCRSWQRALTREPSPVCKTPEEMALFEIQSYLASSGCGRQVGIKTDPSMGESFSISESGSKILIHGGSCGVLYGAYALIEALELGEPLPAGVRSPFYPLRMINCWDNMDGTIERGYAGRSIWFEKDAFCYEPDRIRRLGRMLAGAGINVLCINNVNVHMPAQQLPASLLSETAALADLLRPFGVRLMISIDFSLPLQFGLDSADPLDPKVADFWSHLAQNVWHAVPDMAGFLVKADSEHRPGPNAYGRTHAEGANMLARALKPYGGVLVWRAFVYNCMQDWRDTETDRPCAAYDLYHPMDGAFDDNVILQVKYGPYDFQVREPISPLLVGMKNTRMGMELQLAQEYTGQQIDIFAMPPMWRRLFDEMGKESVSAVAAVSNLGRDDNWTGHPFAALNLYAFGRFAWDPDADPEALTRRWSALTYGFEGTSLDDLTKLLMESARIYELYTSPLGLNWMINPENHYGPNPYGYEFMVWGTYTKADRYGVGIDRTASGTGYVCQYPPKIRCLYEDPKTCPDEYLLFFHRLNYDFVMKDGRTLLQRIYDDHFTGYEHAEKMAAQLDRLPFPEPDRSVIKERMEKQLSNAREWRDVTNTFFCRFAGVGDEKGRKIYG